MTTIEEMIEAVELAQRQNCFPLVIVIPVNRELLPDNLFTDEKRVQIVNSVIYAATEKLEQEVANLHKDDSA